MLESLLACIERTFGNPDQERIAHTQLHALKMTASMTADEYMASFEMLAVRMGPMRQPWRTLLSKDSPS